MRGQGELRSQTIREEGDELGCAEERGAPHHQYAAEPVARQLPNERKEEVRPEKGVGIAGVLKERAPLRCVMRSLLEAQELRNELEVRRAPLMRAWTGRRLALEE
jgi:hypothetical protein